MIQELSNYVSGVLEFSSLPPGSKTGQSIECESSGYDNEIVKALGKQVHFSVGHVMFIT